MGTIKSFSPPVFLSARKYLEIINAGPEEICEFLRCNSDSIICVLGDTHIEAQLLNAKILEHNIIEAKKLYGENNKFPMVRYYRSTLSSKIRNWFLRTYEGHISLLWGAERLYECLASGRMDEDIVPDFWAPYARTLASFPSYGILYEFERRMKDIEPVFWQYLRDDRITPMHAPDFLKMLRQGPEKYFEYNTDIRTVHCVSETELDEIMGDDDRWLLFDMLNGDKGWPSGIKVYIYGTEGEPRFNYGR